MSRNRLKRRRQRIPNPNARSNVVPIRPHIDPPRPAPEVAPLLVLDAETAKAWQGKIDRDLLRSLVQRDGSGRIDPKAFAALVQPPISPEKLLAFFAVLLHPMGVAYGNTVIQARQKGIVLKGDERIPMGSWSLGLMSTVDQALQLIESLAFGAEELNVTTPKDSEHDPLI